MSNAYLGKVIDNYRIIENLGVGGMGVVYKAIHIKLDKFFALKMIAPGLIMDENFIKRFQTEAKALAKFEDPNIVRIYDLRSHEGQWFIVMEFVEGINLQDKIKKDGAYFWKDTLPIIKQILSAIGHAHSTGIVHRDIKPSNVMISKQGTVKITDFGLAKDESSFTNTMTIASGGTLYYMSPEHIKGFSFIDKRSDIYSIGMTFYEMLTGSVPFKDITSDFELRETIVRKEYARPTAFNSDIPAGIEAIVLKSLAKDTDKRFQSAEEMFQAIEAFEAGKPLKSVSVHPRSGTSSISRSNNRLISYGRKISLALSAFTILFLILYWLYPSASPTPPVKDKAEEMGSVSISGLPPEARVFINDDSIGAPPITDIKLPGGEYTISIEEPAYLPFDTTLVLKSGNSQNLSVSMQKKENLIHSEAPAERNMQDKQKIIFSDLTVRSEPSGANVWINNQPRGQTPLRLSELVPQSYQIRIGKEGFENYETLMNLDPGKHEEILASLDVQISGINLITDPSGAQVFLNGKELKNQETPLFLDEIPAGRYSLEIRKSGFSTLKEEIDLHPNQVLQINRRLLQKKGTLSVHVRPWGSIYLDNKLIKESTDIKYITELPEGKYKLEVVHPTLGKWQKSLLVSADEPREVNINFAAMLNFQVNAFDEKGLPVNATVLLDGVDTGLITPATVQARPGNHRITLKKTGYYMENGEKELLIEEEFVNPQTFILKKLK
ncbi:MAG: serine/threonine protein kinase [bacterium]|nr:MAG: serine/threonine protein kinase [bacterium]